MLRAHFNDDCCLFVVVVYLQYTDLIPKLISEIATTSKGRKSFLQQPPSIACHLSPREENDNPKRNKSAPYSTTVSGPLLPPGGERLILQAPLTGLRPLPPVTDYTVKFLHLGYLISKWLRGIFASTYKYVLSP